MYQILYQALGVPAWMRPRLSPQSNERDWRVEGSSERSRAGRNTVRTQRGEQELPGDVREDLLEEVVF